MTAAASRDALETWYMFGGAIGGFATVGTFAVAVVASAVAWRQIVAARVVSREAGAMQAFRDYLKLCFDEPQFSSTEMFQKAHPSVRLLGIETALTPETERYLWFLTVLLSTCEEIAASVSNRGKWRRILILHLGFHKPALLFLWPKWRTFYTDPIRGIVEEAIHWRDDGGDAHTCPSVHSRA